MLGPKTASKSKQSRGAVNSIAYSIIIQCKLGRALLELLELTVVLAMLKFLNDTKLIKLILNANSEWPPSVCYHSETSEVSSNSWSPFFVSTGHTILKRLPYHLSRSTFILDLLWGQPFKLIQVASSSEFHEYWWNDLDFNFFVPSTCCGASEVQT